MGGYKRVWASTCMAGMGGYGHGMGMYGRPVESYMSKSVLRPVETPSKTDSKPKPHSNVNVEAYSLATLFAGTLCKPDATETEVTEAAIAATAHNFMSALPKGMPPVD